MHLPESGYGPVESSSEHGNESYVQWKEGNFLTS
jgi:hypothetical protein